MTDPIQSSVAGERWFATTHWTLVFRARAAGTLEAAEAMEKLCRLYWKPIFVYIRRRGHSVEEAEDLTQEFFARLLDRDYLQRLSHREGRFRSFLLTFVKHFLADEWDRKRAIKRGGAAVILSLDELTEEDWKAGEPCDEATAAHHFDRIWAQSVLRRALERLREEYAAAGRLALFDSIKDLQPHERSGTTHALIAESLGMTESALKSAIHRMRSRHREILRAEVANTVTDPAEIQSEMRHLFEALTK